MKAIGAKNRFILALFLSEALIIGLLGATLGLVIGVAGAYLLTSGLLGSGGGGGGPQGGGSAHFAPIFVPNDLVNVWLLSLSLSIIAGVYPAWKASRLSPLEALRR
jgi:putative ABC transport system permease protein